jgi:hypothetical protein
MMPISKMIIFEMTTSESNEFDRRISLLIGCGAMKDKNWANKEVKKRMRFFFKTVEEDLKGYNIYDMSDIVCAIEGR